MHLAMRRVLVVTARPVAPLALGLALLASGCSTPGEGFADAPWFPMARGANTVVSDSLTVRRVRGETPAAEPMMMEPGNVWPEPEAPRPTLLSGPDEAFRDIPDYRPSLIDGAPPARSPVPTTPAPGARRGSGASLQSLPPPGEPQRFQVNPPLAQPTPPPRPREGQVMIDPSGRPAIATGQAGRVTGFTQPGGGGGAVIRDGNVETWIGPDGQSRTRVVP